MVGFCDLVGTGIAPVSKKLLLITRKIDQNYMIFFCIFLNFFAVNFTIGSDSEYSGTLHKVFAMLIRLEQHGAHSGVQMF